MRTRATLVLLLAACADAPDAVDIPRAQAPLLLEEAFEGAPANVHANRDYKFARADSLTIEIVKVAESSVYVIATPVDGPPFITRWERDPANEWKASVLVLNAHAKTVEGVRSSYTVPSRRGGR